MLYSCTHRATVGINWFDSNMSHTTRCDCITCTVESITGVTSNTGAPIATDDVLTGSQLAAVTVVRRTFVHVYSLTRGHWLIQTTIPI